MWWVASRREIAKKRGRRIGVSTLLTAFFQNNRRIRHRNHALAHAHAHAHFANILLCVCYHLSQTGGPPKLDPITSAIQKHKDYGYMHMDKYVR